MVTLTLSSREAAGSAATATAAKAKRLVAIFMAVCQQGGRVWLVEGGVQRRECRDNDRRDADGVDRYTTPPCRFSADSL